MKLAHFFNTKYQFYLVFALFFSFVISSAQQKDGQVGTEVVNVVKSYQATVSDAFKVKETPSLEDEENTKRENIEYQIFSFPVASTFTPSKGKVAAVEKAKKEKLFDHYATLAFGNYANLLGELYLSKNFDANSYLHANIKHRSTQGGIKDALLDDKFSNTLVELTYGNQQKDHAWMVQGGYQRQSYNWYGLPSFHLQDLDNQQQATFISAIDPFQTYQTIRFGGELTFNEGIFKRANADFYRFSDAFDGSENHFLVQPEFSIEIGEVNVKTNLFLDFLAGTLDANQSNLEYKYTNIGVQPNIELLRDAWTFQLGAGLFYSQDGIAQNGKFYVFPNIKASLQVVPEVLQFYAGATGDLEQNTYRNAVNQNPFVLPTLQLAPTSTALNAHAGLQGKFSSAISYHVKGSYLIQNNRAMFLNTVFNPLQSTYRGFEFGNAFQYVYDDVKTTQLFGELKGSVAKNFQLALSGEYIHYQTTNELTAWNLPNFQSTLTADWQVAEKWKTQFQLFYVGNRYDINTYYTNQVNIQQEVVKLDSFLDANLQVLYQHNQQLSGFLRLQNFANQAYQRWIHTPVQGIQILLGANYKFDF